MTALFQDPLVQAVAGILILVGGLMVIYRAMVERDKERGR